VRATVCLALAACGAPPVFHPDPEKGCADVTLAGQDDVAAAAGCIAVDSLTIKTGMALELGPLRRLETIRGALVVGPTVGFAELSLPKLRTAKSIKLVGNGNLHGVFLPALERVTSIEIHGNGSLTSVSAPALREAKTIAITGNGELEVVTLTAVTTVAELAIDGNAKLSLLDTAALATVGTLALGSSALPDDQVQALRAKATPPPPPE
jgi:hypothetical protein